MIKRAQGLPLNTIVLAIIAILVLIFLVLIFTGGLGKFTSGISQTGPTSQEINATQCASLAAMLNSELELKSTSEQLSLIANSQYIQYGCPSVYSFTFPLSNGSSVACDGTGSISINGKSIPGCILQ
ncbi:MAG: hypothetical protein ACP5GJ_01220 [Nanopusillaceae archaeon]|jgi:preprotein translocase subunit SecF